jgi:hypothetical protein
MTKPSPAPAPSKFARYRQRKRASGMKLLRLWVPDVNAPGFQEEIDRQVALMNKSPDEREVMRWIEAVSPDLDEPPYDWGPEGPPTKDGHR